MSTETRELVGICEQLPQPQRAQVTEYARALLAGLAGNRGAASSLSPLEALSALQSSLRLTPDAARRWSADAAAQRRAWGRAG
jgi:hypothetical protein